MSIYDDLEALRGATVVEFSPETLILERAGARWSVGVVWDPIAEDHTFQIAAVPAIPAEETLRTIIARQLTPLDVAVTHIEILRRKGDEYSAAERDNVAWIVEHHAREARAALFAALQEKSS